VSESFVLIPGRTARQGTSLNQGKSSDEYLDETITLFMNEEDMQRLGLGAGDRVRLVSDTGHAELICKRGPKNETPPGLLFLPYGPPVCALIGGETHGTGMPDSKGIDVRIEAVGSR
jgi:formylmethanofuran dehydrogenase subunit D